LQPRLTSRPAAVPLVARSPRPWQRVLREGGRPRGRGEARGGEERRGGGRERREGGRREIAGFGVSKLLTVSCVSSGRKIKPFLSSLY
ncbi:hypothetical protein LEMLEM_LOCUS9091, partial [Lemmus lemmus]